MKIHIPWCLSAFCFDHLECAFVISYVCFVGFSFLNKELRQLLAFFFIGIKGGTFVHGLRFQVPHLYFLIYTSMCNARKQVLP